MAKTVGASFRANGKINLYLDVLSDGTSGFHKIKSIMQSVSLCDRVTVSLIRNCETEIVIDCPIPFIPKDERNIMHIAAKLFLEELGVGATVNISLDKRIPVSGGMAGGSTDGAAVLIAMNRLYGRPFDDSKLLELCAKLGSDVPFCMMGKTAICEGRGEILTPISNNAKLNLLIVPSSEGVSTPWAYGELDKMYGDFTGREVENEARFERLCKALADGDIKGVCDNMYNIFESAIIDQRPLAKRAKELLLENGALGAMMSGSGPTVFGIFESKTDAEKAASALKANNYSPKFAESIL